MRRAERVEPAAERQTQCSAAGKLAELHRVARAPHESDVGARAPHESDVGARAPHEPDVGAHASYKPDVPAQASYKPDAVDR